MLLFGTFRVIHSNCEQAQTGMTAEALGVSVAPSFFHTCVAAGKTAKMEDVERFKVIGRTCQALTPFLSFNVQFLGSFLIMHALNMLMLAV